MASERMTEAEQITLLQILQREMVEMRQKIQALQQKNEEEIRILQEQNDQMKQQLAKIVCRRESRRRDPEIRRPPHAPRPQGLNLEAERQPFPKKSSSKRTLILEDEPKGHPFTHEIMKAQLPPNWEGLNIDLYDGTTDPDDHVNIYKTQMSLYTSDSSVLCRVFPTSLKGGALSWFTRLLPNSVDCFKTLLSKFGTQFATSRPYYLTSIALIDIRQKKGESLQTFMERFGKLSSKIRNLNLEVAMHHLVAALRPRSPIVYTRNQRLT